MPSPLKIAGAGDAPIGGACLPTNELFRVSTPWCRFISQIATFAAGVMPEQVCITIAIENRAGRRSPIGPATFAGRNELLAFNTVGCRFHLPRSPHCPRLSRQAMSRSCRRR